MKKYIILALIIFVSCSKFGLERKYQKLWEKINVEKSEKEKAKLIKDFLRKYPDTEYTIELAQNLVLWDTPKNSEDFLNFLLGKLKNEERIKEVKYCFFEVYKKNKNKEKIMEVFKTFKEPLKFYDLYLTIDALLELNGFEDSLKLIEKAKEFCKMEKINEEYSKSNEERKNRVFKRRNFEVELFKGRAYQGLKDYKNALEAFEKAKDFIKPSITGIYMDDFNYYYSILLKEMGEFEKALYAILPDVIFEKKDKNFDLFKEIYKEIYGTEEGIDGFLKTKKEEIAPFALDFSLKDYSGKEQNFKEISNGKVTLLSFWFPT